MTLALEDEISNLKANLLMLSVISGAVRTRFDQYLPPCILQSELKKKVELKRNHNFKREQLLILYPTNGISSSSQDYDITLMIAVLRHCKTIIALPANGLDELPLPNERGDGADLARIKYYRNKESHLPAQLSASEYDEFIKKLKPAAERLAGRNLDKEFDEVSKLHVSEIDRDFGKIVTIMIGAYGVVYVWYFSETLNDKYERDGKQYNFCVLDVTSLNQNDQTVLTDCSRKLYYRKCYLTHPLPLIPNTLSWCPPQTDSRSHFVSFPLFNADANSYISRCGSLNVDDTGAAKISLFHRKDDENNFDKSSDKDYDVVIIQSSKGSRDTSENTCHVPRDTTRMSSSGVSLRRRHAYEATTSSPNCLNEHVFRTNTCSNDSPYTCFSSSIQIANITNNIHICPSSLLSQEVDSFSTSIKGLLGPVTIEKKQEIMQYTLVALSFFSNVFVMVFFAILLYKLLVHKPNTKLELSCLGYNDCKFRGARSARLYIRDKRRMKHIMLKAGPNVADEYDQ